MGKELYENNELARQEFDNLFSKLDFDLKTVMFEGPEEVLKETKNTQPAIVSMSLILTKLLEEKGIKADFVAGHSVGEYAAFGAAGYLSIDEAVKLTSARGKFMNDVAVKVNGGMAAIIGLDSDKIVETLKNVEGIVEAVNFNEPKQTVIAGQKDAIERACVALKESRSKKSNATSCIRTFPLITYARGRREIKKRKLKNINFQMTDVKLVANTTAEVFQNVDEIKEEIYKQSFGPVDGLKLFKTKS